MHLQHNIFKPENSKQGTSYGLQMNKEKPIKDYKHKIENGESIMTDQSLHPLTMLPSKFLLTFYTIFIHLP